MKSNLDDLRLEHLSALIALRLSGIIPWHITVVNCMYFNYLFTIPKVSRPINSSWPTSANFELLELKHLSDSVDPWVELQEILQYDYRLVAMQEYTHRDLRAMICHYLKTWTNEAERNARVDYERRELIKLVMTKFETARREEEERLAMAESYPENGEEPYGDDMEGVTLEEWNQHVDRIISEWEQAE